MTQLRAIHLLVLVVAICVFKESSSMILPTLPRLQPLLPLGSHLQRFYQQLGPCGKPCCTTTPSCENCEDKCCATAAPTTSAPVTHATHAPVTPPPSPITSPAAAPAPAPAPAHSLIHPVFVPQPLSADGNEIVPMYRVMQLSPNRPPNRGHSHRPPGRGWPVHYESVPETQAYMIHTGNAYDPDPVVVTHPRVGTAPMTVEELNRAKLALLLEVQRLLKHMSGGTAPPPPPPPTPAPEGPQSFQNSETWRDRSSPIRCGDRVRMVCRDNN